MSTFAVAAIVKDEAAYIEEWAVFHMVSGASSVRIYDNGSTDNTADLVRRMGRSLPVELVDWPTIGRDFNNTQKLAYADAAARLDGLVDFVALIDADEFLVSDPDTTIAAALGGLPPEVGAIACQQRLFGSSGAQQAGPDLVISRFARCALEDHGGHLWFKTIARPDMVLSIETVHSVRTRGAYAFADGSPLDRPQDNPKAATRVCHRPLRLNHYILKSREEFLTKQKRMMAADLSADSKLRYSDATATFETRDKNINHRENLDACRHVMAVQTMLGKVRCG